MAVILVVEDDAFTRAMAELIIHDLDHTVLSATDVDEALLILRSDVVIDAMFTDIYLKKRMLGGCEIAEVANHLRPDCRILYTTGNQLTEAISSSFAIGSRYLAKPYTTDQLETSITHMLAN
jgi:CheY-like chemotaxis protein